MAENGSQEPEQHFLAWNDTIKEAAIADLARWRKKVKSKGIKAAFHSTAIPSAVQAFTKWDLEAAGEDQEAIKHAFDRASDIIKSVDPTPEEFEAYWHGIDDIAEMLVEQLTGILDNPALREGLAARIEADGDHKAALAFFDELVDGQVAQLVGSEEEPGPLTQIFLAGAARGQELHDKMQRQNAPPAPMRRQVSLPVAWDLINKDALAYANDYAYHLVKGMNTTTALAFQESMDEWINSGGSLPGLIDLIHGRLKGLDMPQTWSPAKMNWALSRERARLIAQTESTRVFTEGNVTRWQQLGTQQIKWRTQNDRDVCEVCKALGKEPYNIATVGVGFTIPPQYTAKLKIAKIDKPPLHPGCRCFPAPVTADKTNPTQPASPSVGPRRGKTGNVALG